MKTKEELNALKEEVETMNKKLPEVTEEELTQVSGGLNAVDTMNVLKRAQDMYSNGTINNEQFAEVMRMVVELEKTEFNLWAATFAKKNHLPNNCLSI